MKNGSGQWSGRSWLLPSFSWFLERIKQEEGLKNEEPVVTSAAAVQQPEAHARLEKQIAELTQEVRLLRVEVAAAQAKSREG